MLSVMSGCEFTPLRKDEKTTIRLPAAFGVRAELSLIRLVSTLRSNPIVDNSLLFGLHLTIIHPKKLLATGS